MPLFIALAFSFGLMTLAASGYGMLMRSGLNDLLKQIGIGSFFGLGITASMLDPFVLAPGIIVDGRSLFTGLAAAFLGPVGAVVALLFGVVTRVALGGDGMVIGVAGLCTVAVLGSLWRIWRPRFGLSRIAELVVLGAMISVPLALFAFLPAGPRTAVFGVLPFLVFYLLGGSVVFGLFLDRENNGILREKNLLAAVVTDPLTGLLNRRRLVPEFDRAVVRSASCGMTLMAIDVDHFKTVNDTYGHDVGDCVLKQVAHTLSLSGPPDSTVIRAGGEEFIMILPATQSAAVEFLAWQIVRSLRLPVQLADGRVFDVTSSVGAVHFSAGSLSLDAAMRAADEALYCAKKTGRNRAEVRHRVEAAPSGQVVSLRSAARDRAFNDRPIARA